MGRIRKTKTVTEQLLEPEGDILGGIPVTPEDYEVAEGEVVLAEQVKEMTFDELVRIDPTYHWERRPEETDTAWIAFTIYRDMPAEERRISRAYRKYWRDVKRKPRDDRHPDVNWSKWKADHQWDERCLEHDNYNARLNRIASAKSRVRAGELRKTALELLIQKSMLHLEQAPPATLKDAGQMITAATKELRSEYGDDAPKVIETRDGGTTAAANLQKMMNNPDATPTELSYALKGLLEGDK